MLKVDGLKEKLKRAKADVEKYESLRKKLLLEGRFLKNIKHYQLYIIENKKIMKKYVDIK